MDRTIKMLKKASIERYVTNTFKLFHIVTSKNNHYILKDSICQHFKHNKETESGNHLISKDQFKNTLGGT